MCKRNFAFVPPYVRRRRRIGRMKATQASRGVLNSHTRQSERCRQLLLDSRALRLLSLAVFFSVIVHSTAIAQDASFAVSVDKNPIALGDQFTLSFTLNSGGAGGGKNLKLPGLSNFHIMSGPNQSSSMQFVNGAISSSVTY